MRKITIEITATDTECQENGTPDGYCPYATMYDCRIFLEPLKIKPGGTILDKLRCQQCLDAEQK
jgi:hypothetical protein